MTGPAVLGQLDLGSLIWDSASILVALVDAGGVVIDANPPLRDLTGGDPRGQPIGRFVADGQAETFEAWLDTSDATWSTRMWGLSRTGEPEVQEARVSACRVTDGSLVVVGVPVPTAAVSAALLDVNEVLVTEQRRLQHERRRLDRVSHQDALTGLANRRALDLRLEEEVVMARTGRPFAVVLIDVDRFKVVNDTLGHAAGDEVLRGLAATLGTASRAGDLVGRHGGEEFLAILADADPVGATFWAARLRRSIAEMALPVARRITVSMGVAGWQPGDESADVLARADHALYAAKRAGRDRIVTDGVDPVSPPDDPAEPPSPIWRSSAIGLAIVEDGILWRSNGALDALLRRSDPRVPVTELVQPAQAPAFSAFIDAATDTWTKAVFTLPRRLRR